MVLSSSTRPISLVFLPSSQLVLPLASMVLAGT
ncbi:Uncharacterised protein [Segatella copri]|nr:Uncharacterised protein [Segatella copri]